MKARLLPLLAVLAVVATVAISGCNDTDCPMGSANEVKISFLSAADTTRFVVDSLTVTADGTDSVLLNRENDAYYVTLPLNSTQRVTTYNFRFTMLHRDTVTLTGQRPDGTTEQRDTVIITPVRYEDLVEVQYTAEQKFTSMDCGLVFSYVLETGRHSTSFIKSMGIVNAVISEENEENIYMFF